MRSIVLLILFNLSNTANAQIFELRNNGPLSLSNNDSRSANWIDINNDGNLDIFITNGPSFGQNNRVYLGDGNGNWSLDSSLPLSLDNQPSDGATFADAFNNAFLSAFVANWYNKKNLFYYRDSITSYVALNGVAPVNTNSYSETGSFGDYNRDGYLDLYVSNSFNVLNNYLYHNNWDGTFTEINIGIPVTDQYSSRSVNWIDYDNDGDQDLFVSNENNEKNNLYRNDSNGVFTSINTGPLINDQFNSMSSSWADYDNDGDFDVFISNYGANNQLYRNEGNDSFSIVIDTVGNDGGLSFSASWADVDMDGDLDLFVGNAFSSGPKLNAYFYLNNGDGSFTRNSSDTIAKLQMWNYGNAFGDYDLDGDLDLLTANCHSASEKNYVFTNLSSQNTTNAFVGFECIGTISNRSAIGTKIKVKANINGNAIWQLREISAQSSYCGQNMLMTHFGLLDASNVDSLIVEWTNGLKEVYTNINPNSYYKIIEGQGISVISSLAKQEKEQEQIKVYPNPVKNAISIQLNPTFFGYVDIQLMDLNGNNYRKWHFKEISNSGVISLNVDIDKPGIYLLKINNNDNSAVKKLILE
ncbi:VCBS repeat-containing protein [Hyphobacterium sp. CCMP332]|nr:VCBS repeat-containing protein [Hyphobacterium sp. CCMP332]